MIRKVSGMRAGLAVHRRPEAFVEVGMPAYAHNFQQLSGPAARLQRRADQGDQNVGVEVDLLSS
jgi:hypothetical protein